MKIPVRSIVLVPVRVVGRGVSFGRRVVHGAMTSLRFWACLLIAVIVLLAAYYVIADRHAPLTTDAYIQAYVVQVAPQVGGQVISVHVKEGERVAKGQLLFELDARPFEHKLALLNAKRVEAEQQVKRMDAEVKAAEAEHKRVEAEAAYAHTVADQEYAIYQKESTTKRKWLDAQQKHLASAATVSRSHQMVQQAQVVYNARVGAEHALVAQVEAQLAEARLNLEYTRVHAPCDGIITDLQLREGAYAHVGQAVLACIDTHQWMIVANFRENNLLRMREGQPALVALQGEPGQLFPATVRSVGWGVNQGQGVPSGLLPEVKNTSSWIPLAQRFQVRLELDDPGEVPLRVGMTGSVSVYTERDNPIAPVTEALHRALAWLYYL